jgi:hypothetical protein
MAYRARLKEFDDILQQDVIVLENLRKLAFHGIPDDQGRRALCWRLLLNYLPIDKAKWPSYLTEKRALYKQFIGTVLVAFNDTN